MSEYQGDITLEDTIEWLFTTTVNNVPTSLAGSPAATAYTNGGTTQSATGVTLTADFDSVTGLNKIAVVATDANGFAAGENIEIILSAGTLGGISVVGRTIGSFSIQNRYMRGTDSAASQTSVNDVDTVVDAIKVQTDKFVFTVANQVDSNIQYVNDVQVDGTGTDADPWNPP